MVEATILAQQELVHADSWKVGQQQWKFILPICGTEDWDRIVINTKAKTYKTRKLKVDTSLSFIPQHFLICMIILIKGMNMALMFLLIGFPE